MNRHIGEVIDQLLKVIPPEELDLITSLEAVKEDSHWRAPENQYDLWKRAHIVIGLAIPSIPQDDEEWKWRVIEIFSTKTRAQILEEAKQNGNL